MTSKNNGRLSKQREIELKRRKKRKSRLIIGVIIAIIIGIIVYLLNAETFFLQNIEITGNEQITAEEIIEQSGLEKGKSIFSKLNIVTKVKLKQNGFIKDVKVSRKLPNTILISVEERKKEFQIETENNSYIYIDEQGYIIETSQEKQNLITILGMDITEEQAQSLKRLENNDLSVKLENILHIKQESENIGLYDKVTEIQIGKDYIVKLENEGITINLGNCTNLKNRMFYVKAILEKEVGNKGTINVDGNLNEGFVPYFTAN